VAFTRTETQAAYWVRVIVQIGAREKIFTAHDFGVCVGATKTTGGFFGATLL
jgi:hypothetical protein